MNNVDWIKSYLCIKIIQATPQELFLFALTEFKWTSRITQSLEDFSEWCENNWDPDFETNEEEVATQLLEVNTYRIVYRGYPGVISPDLGEWIGISLNRPKNEYLSFRGKTKNECIQNFVQIIKDADKSLQLNVLSKGKSKVVVSYDKESHKWKGIVLGKDCTEFVDDETLESILQNSREEESNDY